MPFEAVSAAVAPGSMPAVWLVGCEGVVVGTFAQALDHPMVLMADIFETGGRSAPGHSPKTARIHRVRGWGGA